MTPPTWIDYMLMLVGIIVILLIFWNPFRDLPLYKSPMFRRAVLVVVVGEIGIYFLDNVIEKSSFLYVAVTVVVYVGAPLFLVFGDRAADKVWKQANSAKHDADKQEAARLQSIAESEAAFPNATGSTYKTASPTDLTETAKELAEKLGKQ